MARSKKNKKQISNLNAYIIPIILIVIVVPLVVLLKKLSLGDYILKIRGGGQTFYDFYSYFKAIFLIAFTFLAGLMFVYGKIKKNLPASRLWVYIVPLCTYLLFAVLSTVFSTHQHEAWRGMYDRHEGLFVIISYCFLCFYTFEVVNSIEKSQKIIFSIFICTAILDVIGIFQYFGKDFFQSELGKNLMLIGNLDLKSDLTFKSFGNVIYGTFSHYNYVGSFVALVLPIMVTMGLFVKERLHKIMFILLSIATFVVLLGCNARSGLVAIAVSLGVAILLFRRIIWEHRKATAVFAGILILLALITGFFVRDALIMRYQNTKSEIKALIGAAGGSVQEQKVMPLTDFKLSDYELDLKTPTEALKITLNSETEVHLFDTEGKEISYDYNAENGKFLMSNPNYSKYEISYGLINDKKIFNINKENINLFFNIEDGKFKMLSKQLYEMTNKEVEHLGFEGMESFASGRGYIWSRSLPLLKETLFIGFGPDNYFFHFPQDEFLVKLKVYDKMWMVVDKPHNLYLQTALNTGVVSLLVFLVFIGIYVFQSLRLYLGMTKLTQVIMMGSGCFLGIIAYLMTGIFNDSVLDVAPVFWVVLGLGIALNKMVRKENV